MKLLDDYMALREEVFKYFGYVEDYRVIPLDNCCDKIWRIVGGEGSGGCVRYAESVETLNDEEAGNYYENEIYTQRFLPKWG